MTTNSENLRDIVCDLLLEIEREQAPSHVAIRRMLEKYQYLGSGERGFISRLTRGTLERRMTLDWMIEQFSSVKVKKMKQVIRQFCGCRFIRSNIWMGFPNQPYVMKR